MYLATKIKMVRELMMIESESKAYIFDYFVKVNVMMIKFTSQSVEFDRARDIDLSKHASHPKNNPKVQQKEGGGGKRVGWKNRARMERSHLLLR